MNWSAADTAVVPSGVVTVTFTVPGVPEGETAVTEVAEFTVKLVAELVPKWTPVAPHRSVPVMITADPPAVVPVAGTIDVNVGETS